MDSRSILSAAPAALIPLFSLLLAACGAAQIPADARAAVLSLDHLDCADCGDKLAAKLREQPGVYAATFDKRRAEIAVTAAPSFDALAAAKAASAGEDYAVVPGAGKGGYLAWAKAPEGADVVVIGQVGEDVPDLAPHLARGKITVVDFSAVWCEPCRKLDEHILTLLAKRSDVAYRKLDVGDWDTPLAQHYLKTAPQLPYVIVFDKEGRQVETLSGLDIARLDAALAGAAR